MTMQEAVKLIPVDKQNLWILWVFLTVLATAAISFCERKLYHRGVKKLSQTHHIWDDAIIWAIHKPVVGLIWLWGLTLAIEFTPYKTQMPELFKWMSLLRGAGTILIGTWIVWRLTRRVEHRYLGRELRRDAWFDHTTAQAMGQIMRVSILITAALVIIKYFFHIPLTGLWALGGASSIIIGLAAKDLLANFFGAIMIYFDRPFAVGDWIRSPDREIEGIVEYIGWRLTRLRTLDRRSLYIPNAIFASVSVENVTRMTHRRIKTTVGIRYQDSAKLREITKAIKTMIHEHPDIDSGRAIVVNLYAFGPSSLDIIICCYSIVTDWIAFQEIQQDVLMKVLDVIKDHGADVAYPTHMIEFKQGLGAAQDEVALAGK